MSRGRASGAGEPHGVPTGGCSSRTCSCPVVLRLVGDETGGATDELIRAAAKGEPASGALKFVLVRECVKYL